ncbi:hypothetical protein JCM11251_005914 [Rhodosporidiobolus azoricus]
MPTYVIEHMEDDNSDHTFPHWIALEYMQMIRHAQPHSTVIFSSLSPASVNSLSEQLLKRGAPQGSFRAETKSVQELMKEEGVALEKVCLLDPRAEREIGPGDGKEFDWFLFGGILGDDPPRDRTGILRAHGYPGRHLGPIQMTTDTALGVTARCVEQNVTLSSIPMVNHPEIKFNDNESVTMPFIYMTKEGTKDEPWLPEGMKEHLYEDMNREFEDF